MDLIYIIVAKEKSMSNVQVLIEPTQFHFGLMPWGQSTSPHLLFSHIRAFQINHGYSDKIIKKKKTKPR